jgi:hypothetical protein
MAMKKKILSIYYDIALTQCCLLMGVVGLLLSGCVIVDFSDQLPADAAWQLQYEIDSRAPMLAIVFYADDHKMMLGTPQEIRYPFSNLRELIKNQVVGVAAPTWAVGDCRQAEGILMIGEDGVCYDVGISGINGGYLVFHRATLSADWLSMLREGTISGAWNTDIGKKTKSIWNLPSCRYGNSGRLGWIDPAQAPQILKNYIDGINPDVLSITSEWKRDFKPMPGSDQYCAGHHPGVFSSQQVLLVIRERVNSPEGYPEFPLNIGGQREYTIADMNSRMDVLLGTGKYAILAYSRNVPYQDPERDDVAYLLKEAADRHEVALAYISPDEPNGKIYPGFPAGKIYWYCPQCRLERNAKRK